MYSTHSFAVVPCQAAAFRLPASAACRPEARSYPPAVIQAMCCAKLENMNRIAFFPLANSGLFAALKLFCNKSVFWTAVA